MRKLFALLSFVLFINCSPAEKPISKKYADSIKQEDLKNYLTYLASDELGGREPGQEGIELAAEFIKEKYINFGLKPVINKGNSYYQEFTMHERGRRKPFSKPMFLFDKEDKEKHDYGYISTVNVVGMIEGSTFKDEYIVISAHYDHLGSKGERIFNGADDNGSGTSSLLEIAEAFCIAKKKGIQPKRNIVFACFSAEEKGLIGSRYFVENPPVPIENIVANLNIDMVGRNDDNSIYIIGASVETPELDEIIKESNRNSVRLYLDYSLDRGRTPSSIFMRSDQYNFAKYGIPAVFFYGGHHGDYHETSDTIDKIKFSILQKRTKLVFHTAWELSNMQERIDKEIN